MKMEPDYNVPILTENNTLFQTKLKEGATWHTISGR